MYNQVCLLLHLGVQGNDLVCVGKNVVLNVSEMEAKVREVTNDDPWCILSPVVRIQR